MPCVGRLLPILLTPMDDIDFPGSGLRMSSGRLGLMGLVSYGWAVTSPCFVCCCSKTGVRLFSRATGSTCVRQVALSS